MIPSTVVIGLNEVTGPPATAAAMAGQTKDQEVKPAVEYGAIAGHVMSAWQRNRLNKQKVNERLLSCLRAKLCKYSPEELSTMWRAGQAEPVYFGLAAAKMRAAYSQLRGIILPDGDRPWDIVPRPDPELPPEIVKTIKQQAYQSAAQQMGQSGNVVPITQMVKASQSKQPEIEAQARKMLQDEAAKRAEGMRDRIEDHLEDGNWYGHMAEFLDNYCTYPAAILKGPFTQNKKKLAWKAGSSNPNVKTEAGLAWQNVSPFDIFPAPNASDCQQGDFIEILHMTESDLFGLIGMKGYNDDAIRSVLSENSPGVNAWLWEEIERRQLEGNDFYQLQPQWMRDGIHYWGTLKGYDLLTFGIDPDKIEDPLAYYECDVILFRHHVIRCELNEDPLGRRPYHNDSYHPIPGSFWGLAIYELMQDAQDGINGAFRSLYANMALSSGPQVVIDMARLAPGETITSLRPWKEWQMSSAENPSVAASTPFIEFFQPPSNIEALLKSIAEFEDKADDLTGIPRYEYGSDTSGGAASTSSGLAQLRADSAKGLERAVAGIDRKVVAPVIEQVFTWEMLYGEDHSIKGDCAVVPRGSAALLVKEHMQQARTAFLQMAGGNQAILGIIGKTGLAAILREMVKPLGIPVDEVVPSKVEMEKMAQNQPPPQPTPDTVLKTQSHEKIAGATLQAKLLEKGIQVPQDPNGQQPATPNGQQDAPQASVAA